jgi:hypothetical protein
MNEATDSPKPEGNDLAADLMGIKRRVDHIDRHRGDPSRVRRELQQLTAEIDRLIERYAHK